MRRRPSAPSREVNTGIMVAPTARLKRWLSTLSNDNAQGEYYLTDIVAQAVADDVEVVSAQPDANGKTLGVNSKVQLAELERIHQRNLAYQLLEQGVTLADPARIDMRGSLMCGRDVTIDVGCVFEGDVDTGRRRDASARTACCATPASPPARRSSRSAISRMQSSARSP